MPNIRPWQAFRGCSGVGAAFIPLGLAFGVLVSHSGLPWWWAVVFASVIYAGSLEFLLLGMVLAVMPLASVAVTAFLVNFRHIFSALAFPLHGVTGLPAKAYSTFALSDEAYALTFWPRYVAAALTWALRAVPFALLAPLRHNELIRFLGDHSPVGVMIALVGYTVRNVAWLDPAIALPILVSGAITAGLQLWRSNLVLSLAGGTVVHVTLATAIA